MGKVSFILKNFIKYLRTGGVVKYRYATPIAFDSKPLSGKVVLVTGATSGIGLCTAKSLIKMGAQVIVTGRSEVKIKKVIQQLDNAKGIVWDISNASIAEVKMEECKNLFGRLDILVNNAGIYDGTDVRNMQEEIFDKVININCKGTYFVSKAFIEKCQPSEESVKKIINILSIRSFTSSTNAYCISKWGEKCFVDGLAKEVMNNNIIVNNIAPGVTATNINKINPIDNAFYNENEKVSYSLIPEEIVNVIAFLASDMSNGIVGQTITVDGGETIR